MNIFLIVLIVLIAIVLLTLLQVARTSHQRASNLRKISDYMRSNDVHFGNVHPGDGPSYGFPSYTIVFENESQWQDFENRGLVNGLLDYIQEMHQDYHSGARPFDAKLATEFKIRDEYVNPSKSK